MENDHVPAPPDRRPPPAARRLQAAHSPHVHRFGRAADWLLSIAFAALLGTAVWKLDNDVGTAGPQAAPSSIQTSLGRSKAAILTMAGNLFGRHGEAGALTAQQAQPEGWVVWNGDRTRQRQVTDCPRFRPDSPSTC